MEKKMVDSELLESLELPARLQELLPCGYSYKLKKWTPFENRPDHFEAVILTNIYTEEEAQEWWHEFNIKSNTTMRVRATCPKVGKVNTFKIYLRCLHQGRAEKVEKSEPSFQKSKLATSLMKRNTNCPAGMIVAIRRHIRYSRSKMRGPVDPVHPCEIQIRFVHNHPTNNPDSLRFRPVSKESEEKLLNLYQVGHSPASALETLKLDLQVEHGSLYSQIISDRYHCPNKSFCYRLYYKHFGKDFPASAKKNLINVLNDKVVHYNTILGETCLAAGTTGTDYAIAVCTPLMKRAHSLPQSCDAAYIEACESPSNKERAEHHVLLLIAHTAVGGVPLGAILTTKNSVISLTLGFQLLKKLLPEHAFFCRGVVGPTAFLTEDSENQRVALRNVWPDSDVILCIFKLLQHMWQWLWDEKHNILKDHRLYLLYLAKTLLFSSNEVEMNDKYQALCSDNISIHYPAFLQQVKCLWERQSLWGICFHRLSPLQGANNYYEAAARALKDKLLEQTKTFNLVQRLNYLVTRLDLYYRIKLLNMLHNKTVHIFCSHYPEAIPSQVVDEIKQVAGNYFLVPSEQGDEKVYTVDAELNVCSCPYGINGTLCIHQYWIFIKIPSEMFKVSFLDIELKQKLFVVASGTPPLVDTPHTQMTFEVPCVSLPQAVPNGSDIQSDANSVCIVEPICIIEPILLENNSSPSLNSVPQTSTSLVVSLSSSNELVSVSNIDSCNQVSSGTFVNSLPETTQMIVNVVSDVDSCVEGSIIKNVSNLRTENVGSLSAHDIAMNLSEGTEELQENNQGDSETEKRMEEVLEKFEDFCQRVKDGLKSQPQDFLPALEIMMKTLERKGNSTDLIVSGLSFFGVISAPSLVHKERKRPIKSAGVPSEEIIPKVYGRQMVTYGKRRPISNSENKLEAETN